MAASPSTLQANVISLVQERVCSILNSDPALKDVCTFYAENTKSVDFMVKDALSRQGLAAVVMTPTLSYRGRDAKSMYFDLVDAELDITENPAVNRCSSKTSDKYASSQDVACRALQVLTGPGWDMVGDFNPKKVQSGEYNGLLVTKVTFDAFAELHQEQPKDFMQMEIVGGERMQYRLDCTKLPENCPLEMQKYDKGTGVAGDWGPIISQVAFLKGGECLRIRAKEGWTVTQPLSTYIRFQRLDGYEGYRSDANLAIAGNLMRMVTADTSYEADRISADVFNGFFKDWTFLVDAGDATIGDGETELCDNALKEAFSGCTNLKRGPKIPTYRIEENESCVTDIYKGCDSLREIHWNSGLPDSDYWKESYPGAPRFGAPDSCEVIYDL